jgi:hypothetical protein
MTQPSAARRRASRRRSRRSIRRSRPLSNAGPGVAVGGMQPSAAEIEMQARHIACPGPTANPRGGLKHHSREPACRQPARRGNARSAGSDYDYVSVGAHGLQRQVIETKLLIRPASPLPCARPSHRRKPTHSSDRPCSLITSHRAASQLRPKRATQPKYGIKAEARGTRADLFKKS